MAVAGGRKRAELRALSGGRAWLLWTLEEGQERIQTLLVVWLSGDVVL